MTTAALDASNVYYEGQVLNLLQVLDEIKIGNIKIDITPLPLYERGQTIRTLNINWRCNLQVSSQFLITPNETITLESNARDTTLSNLSITEDTDLILRTSTSLQTIETPISIRFGSRIYYGTQENIVDIALNSSVTQIFNSRVYYSYTDFDITLKDIKGYIYILLPTRFIPIGSNITIYSNNMLDTGWIITNIQIKNPFNYVESYRLYRSIYKHKGGNVQLRLSRS